jgi:YesN/AraC family two-component response regulator
MGQLQLNTSTLNPEIYYVYYHEALTEKVGTNHKHDFLEISVILEGSVLYNLEGTFYNLQEGDILLLNPGTQHYETNEKNSMNKQLHIGFQNLIFDGYPRDTFPSYSSIIKLDKHKEEFLHTCREMLKEKQNGDCGYEVVLMALLMKLIILIIRELNKEATLNRELLLTFEEREKQDIANVIMKYMQEHYMEDITLSKISQSMYISPAYISKIFKDETGDSPINYLIKLRLARANELLKHGKLSIKEVARSVGYDDAYHFSKLFKKYYGYPPSRTSSNKETG